MSKPDSHPLPPRSDAAYEWSCPDCGTTYLSKSAACPRCRSTGQRGAEELTKKVVDDNDLRKGGLR